MFSKLEAAQGVTGEHRQFKIMAKRIPAGKHNWKSLEENFQAAEVRFWVKVSERKWETRMFQITFSPMEKLSHNMTESTKNTKASATN